MNNNLELLRELMRAKGVDAVIIPGTDPHQSEYVSDYWKFRDWVSGFTGSNGTAVVTLNKASLWTDSRYFLQAEIELEGSDFELQHVEYRGDLAMIMQWLAQEMQEDDTLAVDGRLFSLMDANQLEQICGENGFLFATDFYPADNVWRDRPAQPRGEAFVHSVEFAGEDVESKLARTMEKVEQMGADSILITALDEIAWLLNIRGNDVEYNPVVISYVVLEADKCSLFVNPDKIDSAAQNYLDFNNIDVQPYEAIFGYIAGLKGTICYDGAKVNEALYEAIQQSAIAKNIQSPILIDKAQKNAVELEGERIAMRQDAAALTRFFKWLEEEAFKKSTDRFTDRTQTASLTEWDLMEKLHEFRAMGENFIEESFGTIAGYQGNGAIVHYAATKENCAEEKPEGMLLLDSGGQYLDGTTDITRTVWLGGRIPQQAKLDYTYVLKGHIALQRARFPRGTRGNQLDALAKQYMWEAGITFGHGTGHGVGHFLGCHEGPQNVRTDNNPTPLAVGHIISDEPGIYRTGKWGIRTENLITVIPAKQTKATTTEDEWLQFETLTLCFYDTNLIEMSLMTEDEIDWLNAYHVRVYKETAPLLNADEAEYLARKCAAIEI